MSRVIIVPVIKSPHSSGRVGTRKMQDWFRGVKKSVFISQKIDGEILVISNAKYLNQQHEVDLYKEALSELGLVNPRVVHEGYETIEQVVQSFELASAEKKDLIFISTFTHFPRVWWLVASCKRHYKKIGAPIKARNSVVFGIPRPREMLTDMVLAIIFPLVDILGGRKLFLRMVNRRRLKGKL